MEETGREVLDHEAQPEAEYKDEEMEVLFQGVCTFCKMVRAQLCLVKINKVRYLGLAELC